MWEMRRLIVVLLQALGSSAELAGPWDDYRSRQGAEHAKESLLFFKPIDGMGDPIIDLVLFHD